MPPKKSVSSKKSPIDEVKNVLNHNNSLNSNINIITFFIVYTIVITLVLILHYAMFTWTQELEKQGCECSDMWHRKVVHWLALVFLIVVPLNIILKHFKIQNMLINIYSSIVGFAFITYILTTFDYIRKLKKLECECSEDWKREYGYIFSIIYISFFAILILSALMAIIFTK